MLILINALYLLARSDKNCSSLFISTYNKFSVMLITGAFDLDDLAAYKFDSAITLLSSIFSPPFGYKKCALAIDCKNAFYV